MIVVIYIERGSWLQGAKDKANTYIKIEEEYPEKRTQLFLLNSKWENGCGKTYFKINWFKSINRKSKLIFKLFAWISLWSNK